MGRKLCKKIEFFNLCFKFSFIFLQESCSLYICIFFVLCLFFHHCFSIANFASHTFPKGCFQNTHTLTCFRLSDLACKLHTNLSAEHSPTLVLDCVALFAEHTLTCFRL